MKEKTALTTDLERLGEKDFRILESALKPAPAYALVDDIVRTLEALRLMARCVDDAALNYFLEMATLEARATLLRLAKVGPAAEESCAEQLAPIPPTGPQRT